MIHVHAERIHYWDGEDEGELTGSALAEPIEEKPPAPFL